MRISDWSSDVCSSDLPGQWLRVVCHVPVIGGEHHIQAHRIHAVTAGIVERSEAVGQVMRTADDAVWRHHLGCRRQPASHRIKREFGGKDQVIDLQAGSEEHTSELQSLMRSSYAVFCLQKKNKNKHYTAYPRNYE